MKKKFEISVQSPHMPVVYTIELKPRDGYVGNIFWISDDEDYLVIKPANRKERNDIIEDINDYGSWVNQLYDMLESTRLLGNGWSAHTLDDFGHMMDDICIVEGAELTDDGEWLMPPGSIAWVYHWTQESPRDALKKPGYMVFKRLRDAEVTEEEWAETYPDKDTVDAEDTKDGKCPNSLIKG